MNENGFEQDDLQRDDPQRDNSQRDNLERDNSQRVGRRDLLRGGALVGASALLSGCSQVIRRYTAPNAPASVALPTGDVAPLTRLLQRTSFGPTPGEIARVQTLGVEKYLDEQLHPDEEESILLSLRLRGIEALRGNAMDLQNFKEREVLQQLQQAAILRATYRPPPIARAHGRFLEQPFQYLRARRPSHLLQARR